MNTTTITREDVYNVIEQSNTPLSATAISRELGYSKKNPGVCALIDELVDDGAVSIDREESYERFILCEPAEEEITDVPVEEDDDYTEDEEDLGVFDSSTVCIPTNTHGYEIEEKSKYFKVTFPNGNIYKVAKTKRILVINQTKKLLIRNPEDIIFAITKFAEDNGIETYLVKDLFVGRTVPKTDVNNNPVIVFVQIERHNKAGQSA